ncbi:PQQ-binding-like beta-propeller repeat protein [Halolamina pelagica]|nr:PQQ-binding-like beta-propeller repeat protein [Halolamina pelagica]
MDGRDAGHTRRVDDGPTEPATAWRTEFDDVRGVGTPSLADGELYVPADAVTETARSRYRLYALSARDGGVRWQVPLRVEPNGAPAVSADRIVVGAKRSVKGGRLVCFHPRYGEEQWLYDVGSRLTAPPTVAEGVVYVGDWSGRVHAIGTLAGTVRWTRRIDAGEGGDRSRPPGPSTTERCISVRSRGTRGLSPSTLTAARSAGASRQAP